MNPAAHRHPASYRDPAGFVFEEDGILYRQIHPRYQPSYEQLKQSGLYDRLISDKLLIPHEEVSQPNTKDAFLIIRPQRVHPVIAPFCWTYNMLQDAALLTLQIQEIALQYGMTLKDAHPSNIQFIGTKPVLIDTLSFATWNKTKPWIAYRQYCESFLLPLVIGHYGVPDSPKLLRAWPGGVPLERGRKMLPLRSKLSLHWLLHLHLHARKSEQESNRERSKADFSPAKMNNLIHSLKLATAQCQSGKNQSVWTNYEQQVTERGQYTSHKHNVIQKESAALPAIDTILDLGSNTGNYSDCLRNISDKFIQLESDPQTANALYKKNKTAGEQTRLSLCLNIEDLLPAGCDHGLIPSLKSDLVLCLGLLHHLTYRNNIPLSDVLNLLARLTNKYLWIEFIDPTDPLILEHFNAELVENRMIDQQSFEEQLKTDFTIRYQTKLADSSRRLYLCEKK